MLKCPSCGAHVAEARFCGNCGALLPSAAADGWSTIGQRPLAVIASVVTLGGVLAMAATAHWVTGAKQVVGPIQGHVAGLNSPAGEPAQLGKQLFTTYLFAFEATAALLVIAVVGAVVLARRPPTVPHELEASDSAPASGSGSSDRKSVV